MDAHFLGANLWNARRTVHERRERAEDAFYRAYAGRGFILPGTGSAIVAVLAVVLISRLAD